MKVKVKICGIQSLNDAQNAIDAGADYVGFIFDKSSKRYIKPSVAKEIIKRVRDNVSIVGVFRDNPLEKVNSLCEMLDFDLVQLHGEEDPEFCQQVIRPVIKVFGLDKDFSVSNAIAKMEAYDVQYYLIDRLQPGEGERVSVKNSLEITKKFPLFFAGGLNPENVTEVVKAIKPFAVDVISGVKTDNKFDFKKMNDFVLNAKGITI